MCIKKLNKTMIKNKFNIFPLFQIGTKNVKQCVQFYYMWKKVCTDEYRRIKAIRERKNSGKNLESDLEEKPYPDAKLLGVCI